MLPRELHDPFASPLDRTRAVQRLLDLFRRLQELERFAELPAEQWSSERVQQFPSEMSGQREHPAERLARWHALFADELKQVRAARNAAAHTQLSDTELRTATYLAEQLLAFAYGRNPAREARGQTARP
jgi:hypothetical protein